MLTDFTLIDGFEKIRGYLLAREPELEQEALARSADATAWKRLAVREYQEALQEIRTAISQAMNGSRFARYHPNADVEIVVQLREGRLLPRIVIRPGMDLSLIKR